jgi:plastocyanin
MFPESVDIGPDGALYVSMPAVGATNGEGMIGRIAVDGSTVSTPMAGESGDCSPIPETLSAGIPVPAGSPADVGTPAPAVEITPAPPVVEATPTIPVGPAATPTLDMGTVATITVEVGTSEIGITNFAFDPTTVEITVGTTVTWTNNDGVPHTATGMVGEFDTGTIAPGASASFTFDAPGTYNYYCQIHPSMQGTVIVK